MSKSILITISPNNADWMMSGRMARWLQHHVDVTGATVTTEVTQPTTMVPAEANAQLIVMLTEAANISAANSKRNVLKLRGMRLVLSRCCKKRARIVQSINITL